jgi:hypothetical protein
MSTYGAAVVMDSPNGVRLTEVAASLASRDADVYRWAETGRPCTSSAMPRSPIPTLPSGTSSAPDALRWSRDF